MKVYIIKNKQTKEYQTVVMDFSPDIRQSDIIIDYEVALAYCPSDCEVVECELLEKNELADHDKKVSAEVVEENQALKERWEKLKEYITQKIETDYDWCAYVYPEGLKKMQEILEKMQELER